MQRVEVDREEHAERDQEQLCRLVDAEPQDHQRDQRQMRHVAHHLQRGVGELAGELATGRWRARRRSRCRRRSGSRALRARNSPRCCARARRMRAASTPPRTTSVGAGRTRSETKPVTQATCQIRTIASGTIQGISPSARSAAERPDARKTFNQTHDCEALCSGRLLVGDGLAERPGVDARSASRCPRVPARAAGTPARRSDRLPPDADSRTG